MKKQLVTESDVIPLAPGTSLRVSSEAIVTPAAWDLIRANKIRVLRGVEQPPVPVRVQEPLGLGERIAVGGDHGGFELKEDLKHFLIQSGCRVVDCGTNSPDPVDYPDIAKAVATLVGRGECSFGIIADGAGIGSCMVANKVKGVRAALCYDLSSARNAREHNDANVLTLGGRLVGKGLAQDIAHVFLSTPFAGGRHAARVEKINEMDRL